MNRELDITFGVTGQTVYLDAPEGRPSSVTGVKVFRVETSDDGTEEDALDTPAIEAAPAAVTLASPAGPSQADPRALSLSSGTDIVAERLYLISEDGRREWIEPLDTGIADMELRYPLANDYTTSATVSSTRITAAVKAAWVADENHVKGYDVAPQYRVRWEYAVGGETYIRFTVFSLVRYSGIASATPTITAIDVDSYANGFLQAVQMDHRNDQGRKLIADAGRQVSLDLRRSGVPDENAHDPEIIGELIIRKTVVLWLQADAYQRGAGFESVEDARAQYNAYLEQFVAIGGGLNVDDSGTGAAQPIVAQGIMVK